MYFKSIPTFVWVLLAFVSIFSTSSVGFGQNQDVARLVHPDVASRLSLTDSQRTQIQALLQQRAEGMVAAADAATKAKVKQDFDSKIVQEVLNDQQKALFASLEPQQKLMFQFREMKWDDVLSWFAKQQDLTLVMDRTPPGSFTYNDVRSYSPSEGIDLLNSVLMTHNFTLVRREKMLVVMELSDSIPLELIPRIKQEELAQRGRFELVSVAFALGGRPIETVLAEVKPYLSNYGRAIPLAQGSQLMVIENAGKMQTINELILSVPVPKATPKPEPVPPPKPVFAAYPLGRLDPMSTLYTVIKLIPSEQITVDTKTGLLSAFVIPDQHKAIKAFLDEMTANVTTSPTSESVAYQFTGVLAEDIKKQIVALAPRALVLASTDRVLVTATPDEQKIIQASLAALEIVPSSESKGLKVFEIDPATATVVEAAMKTFLPKAQIAANAKAGSLIVRGSDRDLQIATEVLDVWKKSMINGIAQLKVFDLDRPADAKWLASAQKLAPNASLWLSENGLQMMMLGTTVEQQNLQISLPSLLTLLPKLEERQLKIYPLTKNQVLRRASLTVAELPTELATMKITDSTNKQELLVWGSGSQHERFSVLLEGLDQPPPIGLPTLPQTYSLEVQESTLVQQILVAEYPDAKITLDTDGTKLSVIADASTQSKIGARVAEFNEQLPKKLTTVLVPYSVKGMPSLSLQTTLAPLLLKAKVTVDTDRNRLLVSADTKTHEDIAKVIEVLGQNVSPDQQKVVIVYPLENAVATQVKTVLDQLASGAVILADDKLKHVVSTGTIDAQGIIKATIAQLDRPSAKGTSMEVRAYDTKKLQAVYLLPVLQKMWPDLQLSADATANRIIASGNAKDLADLNTAMERLIAAPDGSPQSVKTYSIAAGDMTTLPTILGQIAPQALLSSDPISRTVTAWASEEQHQRIAQAVEQISKTAQSAKEPATYMVKPAQVVAVQTSIKTLFPTADIAAVPTTGQLIVVATSEQQKRIADVVDLLESGPNAAERTVKVLMIDPEKSEPTSLVATLQTIIPAQTRIELNPKNNTLLVVGTAEEVAEVQSKLERLEQELPKQEPMTSVVYNLKHGNTTGATTVLATLLPKASVVPDALSRTITVTCKQGEHLRVQELLASFDVPRNSNLETKVYRLRQPNAYGLATVLLTLMPGTSIYGGTTDGLLVATVTEEQHARIAEVVKEYDATPGMETRVFPVAKGDATSLRAALVGYSPKATVVADIATNSLIVTAPKEEMERIGKIVEDIDATTASGKLSRYYPLNSADPTSLTTSLTVSFPKAKFSADTTGGGLLASATTEEHETISKLVEEINAQPGKIPSLKAFTLQHASPELVSKALQSAYGVRTTAGVSFHRDSKTVFVVGSRQDIQIATQLIEQLDTPASQIESRKLKLFHLHGADGKSVSTSIEALFKEASSPVDVKFDAINEQLLVIAEPAQLKLVEDALAQLAPPDQDLEIFNLETGDPYAFKSIAESLFSNEALNQRPSFTVDANQQQVLVRATKPQMETIHQLLKQMGETKIGENRGRNIRHGDDGIGENAQGSRIRVVPMHRKPDELLKEVQRLWPSLKNNPLNIINPREIQRANPSPNDGTHFVPASIAEEGPRFVAYQDPQTPPEINSSSPIIVVTGEDQWTIASDDIEGLNQFENLLDSLLNPKTVPYTTAGNFSVYILRHADAKQLRELFTDLFRSGDRRSPGIGEVMQRIKIVADSRINALVIGGNRADRKIVEELLSVFDSKDLINRLQQITPTIIPLKSASAKNVSDIVKDVYKSQFTSGAGRTAIDIPEGVSTEVATLLQQINAQATAPLLTLSVDDPANMIILRGPLELTTEVQGFIEKIDLQSSEAPSRRVQVLRLESTNSKNLEKALKMLYSK